VLSLVGAPSFNADFLYYERTLTTTTDNQKGGKRSQLTHTEEKEENGKLTRRDRLGSTVFTVEHPKGSCRALGDHLFCSLEPQSYVH
jgi:hypothetical protein